MESEKLKYNFPAGPSAVFCPLCIRYGNSLLVEAGNKGELNQIQALFNCVTFRALLTLYVVFQTSARHFLRTCSQQFSR